MTLFERNWYIIGRRLVCPPSGLPPVKEFVGLCDLVVWDAGENVGEPGVRIDAIQLGRLDQGVCDGGGLAPVCELTER